MVFAGGFDPAFAPTGTGAKGGCPTLAVEIMLRIHFLPQWFGFSDPAMEEALHDTPLYCEFARLNAGMARMPVETTILRFRHLLEGDTT
jgi:IS5 family transposase